ncbi:MAG: hypothetical protein ACI9MC_001800 [Kiritimatiellia bacterium]|jgi:hypothetical protein
MVTQHLAKSGLLLVLLVGCDEPPCTDMTRSPGGLVVTAEEHVTGWGDAACHGCHALGALHRRGCTPGVDLDVLRIEVEQAGDDSEACMSCHGELGSVP